MDWLALQAFIRNWLVGATGLPASSVTWADQNAERPKYPFATLSILVDGARGRDERVYLPDVGDLTKVIEHVMGMREFTVSLKVECLSQHPTQNARYYMTKARTSLSRNATIETFSVAGLAVVNLEAAKQFDVRHALGMTSVGVMDLRLATTIDDFDVNASTDTIKQAEIEGEVESPNVIPFGPDNYGDI